MFGVGVHWASHNQDSYTLIENLSDDGIAQLYVTKFSTISLNLTKLYITQSFAIASFVTFSEIRKICSNSVGNGCMYEVCLHVSSALISQFKGTVSRDVQHLL